MKNTLFIWFILAAMISSCGFDDEEVAYGTTMVYFYNQEYNRNVVVGEGLRVRPGIMFSGLLQNSRDRVVNYTIDPSVITDPSKSELPAEYYTVSDGGKIVVPAGEFQGYITVTLDSAAFLADPKAVTGEYVLPLRLTGSADVDSVNASKDYMAISISYWAKQHGNYYYSGKTVRKSGTSEETLNYKNTSTMNESIRELITTGPTRLLVKSDGTASSKDPGKGKFNFTVELPTHGGGQVIIGSDSGSSIAVSPNGTSTYNADSRTFYLNYKYTDGDWTYEASDTLVFRNRIRDMQSDGQGLNEWR